MQYRARVTVSLKEGMTDPEGKATSDSLKNLKFPIESVRKLSVYEINGIEAKDREEAENRTEEMCKKLLTNSSKDEYRIEIEEL